MRSQKNNQYFQIPENLIQNTKNQLILLRKISGKFDEQPFSLNNQKSPG
jgi:hypothetical protein